MFSKLTAYNRLDEKTEVFKEGFDILEIKLSERFYTSVAAFSADLTDVILPIVARLDGLQGDGSIRDITDIHAQLNGAPSGTAQHLALSHEQKEVKKVTKRIAKAVKEMIDAARKKEAEMKGIPFEKEMVEWAAFDARLESSFNSGRRPSAPGGASIVPTGDVSAATVGGASPTSRKRESMADVDMDGGDSDRATRTTATAGAVKNTTKPNSSLHSHPLSPPSSTSSGARPNGSTGIPVSTAPGNGGQSDAAQTAATAKEDTWADGGIPWYLNAFDISGTTVHEERWTGPETMRAMSEPLSEMDDETLMDVLGQSTGTVESGTADEDSNATAASARPRRTPRISAAADTVAAQEAEDEKEETEDQKLAREKREKANAKRRLRRRRNRW